MYSIDKRILDFIHRHHVLTLATCADATPYCAHLFYAYIDDDNVFVVASEARTRHLDEALKNPRVAGAVVLETKVVGLLRGLQWQGVLFLPDGELQRKARRAYLRRFPFAVLHNAPLWAIRPTFLKYTDNRLGFGKKIIVTLQANEKSPLYEDQ
ncbi:MAG: pyridoxamine 5'-phosphate oxidase family protein [Prevotellaceae bacterium]|jgi:uncharacterized protein YhbP (UPF0306 family)|nr:pyridoxamine 5'-phosphate oxidase family protein [Prevotellaceae bacterium]